MSEASNSPLQSVRFRPGLDMQEKVYESFSLRTALEQVPDWARLDDEKQLRAIRSHHARITRRMAPGIFAVLDKTRERLGFEGELEVLIDPEEGINATAFPTPLEGALQVISITAGAVKQLDEPGLACVLGHEFGHLAFGHADFHRDTALVYRDEPVPELLQSRLRVLGRLQELSADRAGALAVENDLLVAARTELRVATGLGPEHLQLDLESYAKEVARIEAFDIPHHLFEVTHPLLPIRMRALQLFVEGAPDEEILELARLMDFEAVAPEHQHARDLLLSGGLIAAHTESGELLSDEQRAHLVELILPFTDDPEAEFARVGTIDEAIALFNSSAEWLRENTGPERFEYFGELVQVTLRDGEVTEDERQFLIDAASALDIPASWVERQLRKHQEAAARVVAPPRRFGLRFEE